jgi:hypothetical protein
MSHTNSNGDAALLASCPVNIRKSAMDGPLHVANTNRIADSMSSIEPGSRPVSRHTSVTRLPSEK